MNKRPEFVVLVDDNDIEIGVEEKLAAHQHAKLHRAFSVFLLRNDDRGTETLLQQRSEQKYHCRGLWANTCCSHPRQNETVLDAGQRRLIEEIGIATELLRLDSFQYRAEFDNGLTEYEIDHVCIGSYHGDPIRLDRNEVQNVRWVGIEELATEIIDTPDRFVPWLKPALEIVMDHRDTVNGLFDN